MTVAGPLFEPQKHRCRVEPYLVQLPKVHDVASFKPVLFHVEQVFYLMVGQVRKANGGLLEGLSIGK